MNKSDLVAALSEGEDLTRRKAEEDIYKTTVLAVIKRSRKGVDVATLRKKTGFESRKISGIVQRFKKRAKSRIAERALCTLFTL